MSEAEGTDGEETVLACPYCDEGAVYERTGNGNAHKGNPKDRFYCTYCKRSFNEPVVRERYASGGASRKGKLSVSEETLDAVRRRLGIDIND